MAALSLRSSAIGVRKFGAASSRHSHGMCHKKDINGCEFGENDDIKDLVVSSSLHSHGKCHNKGCNISIIALYCCKRSFKLLAKWSRRAAEEAEHVATISFSGHGRAYVDGFVTLHPFFSLQFFRQ